MILEFKNLKKTYGSTTVINIPDLTIHDGESVGLVGNNGAGKTTLFRMILDLIRPQEGQVLSRGVDVTQGEHWKSYTASYLDEGFLIDYLTAEEYFLFIGAIHDMNEASVSEYLTKYDEFFNGEILGKDKYIRDFSKGNQNKIGIAAGLMISPDLLILDEPFANLDPTTQIRLKVLIKSLKIEKGLTILISSHDLSHVTEVCDRIILLEKGVVIKDFAKDDNTLKELEDYFSS